jgi:hypothetical protein
MSFFQSNTFDAAKVQQKFGIYKDFGKISSFLAAFGHFGPRKTIKGSPKAAFDGLFAEAREG